MFLNLDYFKTALNGIKQYVQSVQKKLERDMDKKIKDNTPDWNQNDPEGYGYIENRPFYTEEAKDIITDLGNTYTDWVKLIDGETTGSPERKAVSYRWNGRIYKDVVPTYYSGNDVWVYKSGDSEFVCSMLGKTVYGYSDDFQFVSITHKDGVVHTISPKYIEDMYYSEVIGSSIEGTVIKDVAYNGTHGKNLPFKVGQVWSVNYGTGTYSDLEVKQDDDGNLYIGDLAYSRIPFYISTNGKSVSNSGWISIIRPSLLTLTCTSDYFSTHKIHEVPHKYYNSKFIINLTIKDKTITADKTFDEVKEAYDNNQIIEVYEQASETILPLTYVSYCTFQFKHYTLKDNKLLIGYLTLGSNGWGYSTVQNQSKFFMINASATTVGQIPQVKTVDNDGEPYIWKMVDLPKMDYSLALTSCSPGQVLVVKTVDDNGKPLTWEAKDISDLVSNGNEVSY